MARSFVPTERDRQIVAAVSTHRALTTDQLALLFWGHEKASSRCRYRLRLLAENGYLERAEQPVTLAAGRRPLVYFLNKKGVAVAAEERGIGVSDIDWKLRHNDVKWPFLDHLLATNDIRVRFEVSAPKAGFTLLEWVDDKSLASISIRDTFRVRRPSGRVETMAVGPDGYVSLLSPDGTTRHRAFVEADRGTVPLTRWAKKVEAYRAYFQSDVFASRYQASKPFRVLTVTTGPDRLENMLATTLASGGATWFWFSTFSTLRASGTPLMKPVWRMTGSPDPAHFPHTKNTRSPTPPFLHRGQ